MAKILYKFQITIDPLTPTSCVLCRAGGLYTVKLGAPELRNTDDPWVPEKENGCFFPDKHLIILNPKLSRMKLWEAFWHEYWHAQDHAETCRKPKEPQPGAVPWYMSHEAMFRSGRSLAKFMTDNNLELVQRKATKHDEEIVLEEEA